jgi:hypothetical protein
MMTTPGGGTGGYAKPDGVGRQKDGRSAKASSAKNIDSSRYGLAEWILRFTALIAPGASMNTKPRKAKAKKAAPAKMSRAKALSENVSALVRHTKELDRCSMALAAHTAVVSGISAKQLVYDILEEPLTLSDKTPLSKLGFDYQALAGLAGVIGKRGVKVDTGLVQACKKIADLVKVVAAAMARGT